MQTAELIHKLIEEFYTYTAQKPSRLIVGVNISARLMILEDPMLARERLPGGKHGYSILGLPISFVQSDVLEVASDDPTTQLSFLKYKSSMG